MKQKTDLTNRKFGRLTVLEQAPKSKNRQIRWKCLCDCGKEKIVIGSDLINGHTKSCSCLRVDMKTTHGVFKTRLYWILRDMKRRCNDTSRNAYERYGGRGIKVCDEWDNPKAFYDWAMANGYADGLQIDRIDNDGDYTPSNCRWVTKKANLNNTRQNVYIEYNGERRTIAEWVRITGIPHNTITYRLKAGKPPEEILKK